MLIDRDYLLEMPPGPPAPKRFFDQQIVPIAVNFAGAVEVALVRAADRSGVRPSVIVSISVAALTVSAVAIFRRKLAHVPGPDIKAIT